MTIQKKTFGIVPDGRTVNLFTLDNGKGTVVRVSDYGGIIVSLKTPDRAGKSGEIGLGFDTLEGYLAKPNYYGALVGRVANRIRDGEFTLEGKRHRLWVDADGIHLHGGQHGFNTKLWRSDIEGDRLRLSYTSPDGEEHYPGTLSVTVWYCLAGPDLTIEYQAVTDKTTIVSLTNHEYFNLTGCKRDVLAHEVRIAADSYTPTDERLVLTGEIAPVKGTALDFNQPKAIGRDIGATPGGYDHNFVLNKSGPDQWLATVYEPDSGRTLAMATTEPCVQFYSGNFLDGTDIGIGGTAYKKHYGFCLEAQKHPDAINHPHFASVILRPGETYRQTTVYRFGTR